MARNKCGHFFTVLLDVVIFLGIIWGSVEWEALLKVSVQIIQCDHKISLSKLVDDCMRIFWNRLCPKLQANKKFVKPLVPIDLHHSTTSWRCGGAVVGSGIRMVSTPPLSWHAYFSCCWVFAGACAVQFCKLGNAPCRWAALRLQKRRRLEFL